MLYAKLARFITDFRQEIEKDKKQIEVFVDRFPIARILFFFITSRIALYIFALVSFGIFLNRTIVSIEQVFIEQWWRWDSLHYIEIASHGYINFGEERFNIVFFPLYSILIYFVSLTGLHPVISGIIISNIAALFAIIYLFKLVKLDFDKTVAEKTVFFLIIFPTAYFLSAVYTESLFLALTIASFYYARKDRWVIAGFLGMLAVLTRSIGVVIFAALLFEYLHQKKFNWRNIRLDILALWLIPLGLGIYLLINYFIYGNYWHFLDILRDHWFKYPAYPWEGYNSAKNSILWRQPAEQIMLGVMEIVFAFLGLIASLLAFRIRLSYGVYSFLSWFFITSTSFWMSIPRYTLTFFPIFIVFALLGKSRIFSQIFIFISLIFLSLFTIQFILGRWAF